MHACSPRAVSEPRGANLGGAEAPSFKKPPTFLGEAFEPLFLIVQNMLTKVTTGARGSRRVTESCLRWKSQRAASHLNTKHGEGDAAVVFLTGANGFLGGAIAETIAKKYSQRISKVYCPLRAKEGMAGEERFRASQLEQLPTAMSVSDSASLSTLPQDATHLILNAYDTRFFYPTVDDKLRDNVKPMLHLLDQCHRRNNSGAQRGQSIIQGITVVFASGIHVPVYCSRFVAVLWERSLQRASDP